MSAVPETATEDPIAYFVEDQEYHGKSERTIEAYERVLRDFEGFLADPDRVPTHPTTPAKADRRECMAWVHSLRGEYAPSTVATYASYLHRFYAYMTQIGVFEANPMSLVVEEMDESIEKDPARREISIQEMRTFVSAIGHPLDRAVIVMLLKTGMRVGELCNLDIRDVHLSETTIDSGAVRPTLEARPNTIYVDSTPRRGNVVNGELREASNKRRRETYIPIDDELARMLEAWVAIRPDPISEAKPLFLSTGDDWGHRLTPQSVRHALAGYTSERGWHRTGGTAGENVTPHYFRHFFTTHLRDRTGDRGVVKYLRGDVADDIIDTYTHNWGDRVRAVYEEHIYSLVGDR